MRKIISLIFGIILIFQFFMPAQITFAGSETLAENIMLFYDDFSRNTIMKTNDCGTSRIVVDENSERMHFYKEKGMAGGGYADAIVPLAGFEKQVIASAEITPVKISGGAKISLFNSVISDRRDDWNGGVSFKSDHGIWSGSVKCGQWSENSPLNIALLFDREKGKMKVKINDTAPVEVDGGKFLTDTFRIDIENDDGSDIEFYVDDLRIYKGDYFLPDSSSLSGAENSVMDKDYQAKAAIGNATLFTDNIYYYKGFEKKKYEDGERALITDDTMYISDEILKNIFSINNTSSFEKYEFDGKIFIKAEDAAENLGAVYHFDKRGFCVFSEEEFLHKNSDIITQQYEISDIIYRYIYFENSKGDRMLSAFYDNVSTGEHPRLLFKQSDIDFINKEAKSDFKWATVKNNAIRQGDSFLTKSLDITSNCPDGQKIDQVGYFLPAIEALSLAYLLTGEETYAVKGIDYMRRLCAWESLAYRTHNLTTGYWALGMAIGYDSFYNFLQKSQEGKEIEEEIKDAAARLAFADTLSAYEGRENAPHWIKSVNNFSGFVSGGVIALCLSMADEYENEDDMAYLLENLINTLEISASLYGFDGGYYEGVSYAQYTFSNLLKGLCALQNCMGTDFDIGKAKGFADAGEFLLYMQTVKHRFNFSDATKDADRALHTPFFGYYYGKTDAMHMEMRENDVRGGTPSVLEYLLFSKAKEKYGKANELSRDAYFDGAGSGTFRSSFNSKNPTFVGFHGGKCGIAHDMLDAGSFIFEADDVLWAEDLGKDNYNLSGYFETIGYNYYRKSTQGENCLVINPDNLYDENGNRYYGQAIGESAKLEKFVSNPNGAFAVLNLSNVYKRDASLYKRGYYFGDGRSTLLIQDEITLKNDNSKLYWFMNTSAEISISDDGKSAILTKDDKSLKAEVYCNKNFTLSKMNAEPLGGWSEGSAENKNKGYTKIALFLDNASENVEISVKLTPQNNLLTSDKLIFTPMDLWNIEDDEKKPIISDVKINPFNTLIARTYVPAEYEKAFIVIDGQYESEIKGPFGTYEKICVDFGLIPFGKHTVVLKAVKNTGAIVESEETNLYFFENEEDIIYENKLTSSNAGILPEGWTIRFNGYGQYGEDGVKVYWREDVGGNYLSLNFRNNSLQNPMEEGIYLAEWKMKPDSLEGNVNVEFMNSNGEWYVAPNVFCNGLTGTGEKLRTDKWYNIKILVDAESRMYTVYIDEKPMQPGRFSKEIFDITCVQAVYFYHNNENTIQFSDFKVSKMKPEFNSEGFCYTQPVIKMKNGKTVAEIAYNNISGEKKDTDIFLATYKGKSLVDVKIFRNMEIGVGKSVADFEGVTIEEGESIKAFIRMGGNILRPL